MLKLHADFRGKQVISNLFGSSVEDLHGRLIAQTPTQTSALSAPAYSKVAHPQIDPHSISWMTFMCPSADLSAGFILFLLCLLLWVLRKEVIWMSTTPPPLFESTGVLMLEHHIHLVVIKAVCERSRNLHLGSSQWPCFAARTTFRDMNGVKSLHCHHCQEYLTRPVCTLSFWHVLCGIFITTLISERLSMNGCWKFEVVEASCSRLGYRWLPV